MLPFLTTVWGRFIKCKCFWVVKLLLYMVFYYKFSLYIKDYLEIYWKTIFIRGCFILNFVIRSLEEDKKILDWDYLLLLHTTVDTGITLQDISKCFGFVPGYYIIIPSFLLLNLSGKQLDNKYHQRTSYV